MLNHVTNQLKEKAGQEAQRISALIAQGINPRKEKRRQGEADEQVRVERAHASVTALATGCISSRKAAL